MSEVREQRSENAAMGHAAVGQAGEAFAQTPDLCSLTSVIDALTNAPEHVNPAIALAVELQQAETRGDKDALDQAVKSGAIEQAIIAGEREGNDVMRALAACGHAPPVASSTVPVGF